MKRVSLFAAAVIAVTPLAAQAAPAEAATNDSTVRVTAQAQPSAAASLAARRAAAYRVANLYAAQAPRLSTQQKARNADTLARTMRVPGISVPSRAVAIGKTQLGTKYRWGGTTPAGFDCSGFTKFAYGKAGKTLPRTAAQQQRAVRRVSSPRVGDLVFVGARAHHVGIYVGGGKMLHSPRTGKPVQVAKIWTKVTYGRV